MTDQDPMADARARTKEALRGDVWPSIKVTAWAVVFGTGGTAVVAFGLFDRKIIEQPTMVLLIVLALFVSGVLVFLAQELQRLYERSEALRELYDAQKQYEVLLRDARAERDRLMETNVQLMHQHAALQAFIQNGVLSLTAAVRAQVEKETPP
jgi:hypothetical protein